jgi:hypothetical protein
MAIDEQFASAAQQAEEAALRPNFDIKAILRELLSQLPSMSPEMQAQVDRDISLVLSAIEQGTITPAGAIAQIIREVKEQVAAGESERTKDQQREIYQDTIELSEAAQERVRVRSAALDTPEAIQRYFDSFVTNVDGFDSLSISDQGAAKTQTAAIAKQNGVEAASVAIAPQRRQEIAKTQEEARAEVEAMLADPAYEEYRAQLERIKKDALYNDPQAVALIERIRNHDASLSPDEARREVDSRINHRVELMQMDSKAIYDSLPPEVQNDLENIEGLVNPETGEIDMGRLIEEKNKITQDDYKRMKELQDKKIPVDRWPQDLQEKYAVVRIHVVAEASAEAREVLEFSIELEKSRAQGKDGNPVDQAQLKRYETFMDPTLDDAKRQPALDEFLKNDPESTYKNLNPEAQTRILATTYAGIKGHESDYASEQAYDAGKSSRYGQQIASMFNNVLSSPTGQAAKLEQESAKSLIETQLGALNTAEMSGEKIDTNRRDQLLRMQKLALYESAEGIEFIKDFVENPDKYADPKAGWDRIGQIRYKIVEGSEAFQGQMVAALSDKEKTALSHYMQVNNKSDGGDQYKILLYKNSEGKQVLDTQGIIEAYEALPGDWQKRKADYKAANPGKELPEDMQREQLIRKTAGIILVSAAVVQSTALTMVKSGDVDTSKMSDSNPLKQQIEDYQFICNIDNGQHAREEKLKERLLADNPKLKDLPENVLDKAVTATLAAIDDGKIDPGSIHQHYEAIKRAAHSVKKAAENLADAIEKDGVAGAGAEIMSGILGEEVKVDDYRNAASIATATKDLSQDSINGIVNSADDKFKAILAKYDANGDGIYNGTEFASALVAAGVKAENIKDLKGDGIDASDIAAAINTPAGAQQIAQADKGSKSP